MKNSTRSDVLAALLFCLAAIVMVSGRILGFVQWGDIESFVFGSIVGAVFHLASTAFRIKDGPYNGSAGPHSMWWILVGGITYSIFSRLLQPFTSPMFDLWVLEVAAAFAVVALVSRAFHGRRE